jgi:signal transduction protein with GAF and PtsI domain
MSSSTPEAVALAGRIGDALGRAARPLRLQEELTRTASAVRALFGAAACSIARAVDDGGALEFVAADGAGARQIIGVTLPVSRGIAGWVAVSGSPMQVREVADDSRFARDVAERTEYIPQTILAAPVMDEHGETIGVIEVLDPREGDAGSGAGLDTLGVLASQVGAIMRLAAHADAVGSMVLKELAGDDEAPTVLEAGSSPVDLAALADAFGTLAGRGAEATTLAEAVLRTVADHYRRG